MANVVICLATVGALCVSVFLWECAAELWHAIAPRIKRFWRSRREGL